MAALSRRLWIYSLSACFSHVLPPPAVAKNNQTVMGAVPGEFFRGKGLPVAKNQGFHPAVSSGCGRCLEKERSAAKACPSPANLCCWNRLEEQRALRCDLEQLFSASCFVPGLGTVPSHPQKANRLNSPEFGTVSWRLHLRALLVLNSNFPVLWTWHWVTLQIPLSWLQLKCHAIPGRDCACICNSWVCQTFLRVSVFMYSSLNQILDGQESECGQVFVARNDGVVKQRKWEKKKRPYLEKKVRVSWDKPGRENRKG